MFAVPGWSVSADSLKAEKPSSGPSAPGTKKRKRSGRPAQATTDVNASTVADLWESVIEGKPSDAPKQGQSAKKQKKEGKDLVNGVENKADRSQPKPKEKKDKKDKKDKKQKPQTAAADNEDAEQPETSIPAPAKASTANPSANAPPALPPAPPKLTPLQAAMREKLVSARFRHLNETLYTRPSEEAFGLFQDSPEMFDEYHEGFRRQVKVWPENPVDSFLADIRGRGRVRPAGRGRPNAPQLPLAKTMLPRTAGECTIADLGCGDARIAEALQADGGKKLRVAVKSFDLQSPSPLVTKADIANLPLPDGSVNVAIFCLALMGTNWVDFIEEAYRVLHWKGELWVAEIKSRFGPVRSKNAPVTHSVGNRRKQQQAKGAKGKGKDAEAGAANDEDLAVEVDGADDRRNETDVSAFVEVLKSRGFVLQGMRNEAVDLSNRMFVKMHFIKGASPTKGKDAKPQEPPKGKRGIIRKLDALDDEPEVNEASILKPCVYKIR